MIVVGVALPGATAVVGGTDVVGIDVVRGTLVGFVVAFSSLHAAATVPQQSAPTAAATTRAGLLPVPNTPDILALDCVLPHKHPDE